ncbi:MAG: hypothetical protein P4L36_15340 [Holophaga sp.]|nr:hypothetical protein [Holophaga sp.]
MNFTLGASAYPSPSYRWERSNDSGSTWFPIDGATSATYSFTPQFIDDGAEFQAIASNSQGDITSHVATLTVMPTVYAGGFNINGSGISVPGYWLNGVWVPLTPLSSQQSSWVYSLAVSGGQIYAAGYSVDDSGTTYAGYWLNGSWVQLGINGIITCITKTENHIYAGGYCWTTGINVAGCWLDGSWIPLPPFSGSKPSTVTSLAVVGNDVYATGQNMNVLGQTVAGYWLNGQWQTLAANGSSNCIVVSGGVIYVGGAIATDAGYWVNGEWMGVTASGSVTSLCVEGGDVIAGGYLSMGAESPGGIPGYWLNGGWVAFPQLSSSYPSRVNAIAISGADIIAAGYSSNTPATIDGVPGYWDNRAWVGLPTLNPPPGQGSEVNSIYVQ